MFSKQEVYRSCKLDDNVKTASLGVLDQVRLIFAKMSNDDAAELETAEKLSVDRLKKVAALKDFLEKAIYNADKREVNTVTVRIAPELTMYVEEVVSDSTGLGRYYNFEEIPQRTMDRKAPMIMRISKKEAEGRHTSWENSGSRY